MPGDDIIDRLLSTERQAEKLVESAQTEADRQVRELEQSERLRYAAEVAARSEKLAAELAQLGRELDQEREAAIARYRRELADRRLNTEALNSAIESILDT